MQTHGLKTNNRTSRRSSRRETNAAANAARQGEINRMNYFGINNLSIQEFRKLQWGYFIKKYHLGETGNGTIDAIYNTVINNKLLLEYFTS